MNDFEHSPIRILDDDFWVFKDLSEKLNKVIEGND